MVVDIIGRLVDRMMNMDNNRTFDRTTDSLEAIAAAIAGIGGGVVEVGLGMVGIVDATQVASDVTVITNNLLIIPNDVLEGQFWMQVIYNTSAPGTAPEGEFRRITNFVQGGALQTFTVDAFSANVEADDYVFIVHESLLSSEILARGTLDTSSATVPEDSTRPEGVDYFKGALLMTTAGAVAFQQRRIVTSSAAGVFTLDPNNPFSGVPGLVDYIIISGQAEFIPGVDGVNNRTPTDVIGGKTDTAAVVIDNVSSAIRYLKGLTVTLGHVPKFTGEEWYVNKAGNDANSGTAPDDAFLTILFSVSAAAVGDRITVMAGVYDEADLDLNLDGLELICEIGVVITHSVTPDTVLIVSADYCRVEGPVITQAGQTGMRITGAFCDIERTVAFGCAVGFDDDGLRTHMADVRSIQHTTTGFAISGSYGERARIHAVGAGAVRGIHLDVDTADHNHFQDSHTSGNTIAGWEVIVGADNNLFSYCTTGGGDGAKVDAGADNTWASFAGGSQIVAGQTRDQDMKDIYDLIAGLAGSSVFQEQADTAVNITAINGGETDFFDLNVAATRYKVRSLRLKCADPGANTVTVRLYELVNDVSLEVDQFEITTANFTAYYSMIDMFGLAHLAGDDLQVTVRASAGGPYVVTGQYSHATAT